MSSATTKTETWIPDFLVVGPQKCATTWIYEGLAEHPEVYVPETDSVHYFDMNFHRGSEWYREFFPETPDERIIGEETPSYIRSSSAPKRIAETNEEMKLIFSLRNPVDRAFSHYWHEKSKGKISFEFEEVFENYDLFENWLAPGMYNYHLTRFEEQFDRDQLKVLLFDELIEDDEAFLREIYQFVGVDPEFQPSILDERVNEARWSSGIETVDNLYYTAVNFAYRKFDERAKRLLRPVHEFIQDDGLTSPLRSGSESEYERGMDPRTRERLEQVFVDDVRRLSTRLDHDFADWFEHVEFEDGT